nr:hypothetical protein CFP56_38644 [Quercus suber]
MGKLEYMVDSPAQLEKFRATYRIPPNVGVRYCPPEKILTDQKKGEVVILVIAFLEGGMTIPMGPITTSYLRNHRITPWQCAPNMFRILGAIEDLNRHLGLGLTWLDVVHMYEFHSQQGAGYYLKSQSDVVRLISYLPKSNKGMKDDYVIISGAWYDGPHCPTRPGEPDKRNISPRLSLTNFATLNFLLRSEIFVSEDGQLRSAPLILGYKAKRKDFQPVGNAIVQGDKRLHRIDVSFKGFLAPHDLPPVPHPNPREEQIDKFHFGGEASGANQVVEVSDTEEGGDRQSSVHPFLVTALPNDSSDEDMADLKRLMRNRGQKAEQKGAGTSQPVEILPPVPPKAPELGLKPIPNLQRKRPHEPEEREVGVPPKTNKQQKTVKEPRGKKATSTESRDEVLGVEDKSLRNYDGGRAGYVAEALQQPLLLPLDIESYRRFNQQELFLSLKKDIAMITQQIYMAEEWNRKSYLEAQAAVQSQSEVERALGQLKEEYARTSEQIKARKQLRTSEINLATERELVKGLRAELQKVREGARAAEQEVQLAKESVEAERKVAYQLGVDETGKLLTEQFASVARKYCDVTWQKALDVVGVPLNSPLRLPGSIYYDLEIQELPETDSPPAPQLLEAMEQSLVSVASPSALDAPREAGLPVEPAKDKGQGLDEEKTPAESQSQAPEAAAQTGQVADPVVPSAQE